MPRVIFVKPDGARLEVEARAGESVLALAWRVDVGIEGDCEGAMACSTCHVVLEPEAFDRLPPPSEEEDSILDLAPEACETSRLGCQIVLTDAQDGIVLRLPKTAPSLL